MKFCPLLLVPFALSISAWQADPPYYAQDYMITGVRGLFVDPFGDLLAISRSTGGVHVIYEEPNGDGIIDIVQEHIIQATGLKLNHGIAFNNGYIYASSAETVYRWPYTPGDRTVVTSAPETVVYGMPPELDHDTRTLIFDEEGRLYVSVGSEGNVDLTSARARIRRFSLKESLPIQFTRGEVFADGLRNEVGLSWNLNGILYGVENGAERPNRADLGGDIDEGNPAEEMNRFDGPVGQHYGYPYCFSTYNLTGYEAGTQFAWHSFIDDGYHDDRYCRNMDLNQPPQLAMPAHHAPLGIDFFRGQGCAQGNGAFPCEMIGDAFVAFHGPRGGRRVARYPFNGEEPTKEDINVIHEPSPGEGCNLSYLHAVNAVFSQKGSLLVSSDVSGVIVKVTYGTPPQAIRSKGIGRQ